MDFSQGAGPQVKATLQVQGSISILHHLKRLGRSKDVPKGALIFEEGEIAQKIYLVERGAVALYVVTPSGDTKTIAVCPSGSIIGESCLCSQYFNVCSAVALENCFLVEVPRDALLREFHKDADLGLALYSSLVRKLEMVTLQVKLMTLKRPRQRVGRILLEHGTDEVRIDHQSLAAMAGCSRVTVTRCLDRLKEQGIIELGRKRIVILDRKGLEALAEA